MAVLTRPCKELPCLRQSCRSLTSKNGMIIKSSWSAIKTQLVTIGTSLTLFNSARLPREAFRYGAVPYLVAYSLWLLIVTLATSLLQMVAGQLSQQDPVKVWRAVPILKGVGHIQQLTSYLLCIYNMLYLSMAAAYMLWIGMDSFPLRACSKVQMTSGGYENKMSALECFNTTFLSPLERHPQYLGVMAIIIFVLWFFVPLILYKLDKSFKAALCVLTPITLGVVIALSVFLAEPALLETFLLSCEHWSVFAEPHIWFSALVQALMSTQIATGYLVSAGATVYKHSDIRWISTTIVFYNLLSGWMWVILWQCIGGDLQADAGFLNVFILIYQSSSLVGKNKIWPILAYGAILVSGAITILTLLYPIFDRLHRLTSAHWKIMAGLVSAFGTCFSIGVFLRAVEVSTLLDELVVPILVVFSATFQIVGFVFIYGFNNLKMDVEFLTGSRSSNAWIVLWCLAPLLTIGMTGWWLKVLLRETLVQMQTLWPVAGTFIMILIIMAIFSAMAVAKEEQFNLLSKFAAAFRPSRLWGPEDPTIRYNWMLQRYTNEENSNEEDSLASQTHQNNYQKPEKIYDWTNNSMNQTNFNIYTEHFPKPKESSCVIYAVPKKKRVDNNFVSPNICLAKDELDSRIECKCNRHFTLNVPYLMRNEVTTSL